MKKNITDQQQLKKLIEEIQTTNQIPLFISIDQEGGTVPRIKWNSTFTKSPKEVNNWQDAYELAKMRGNLLKELGFNMNLSPVAEYITSTKSFIYQRTFNGTIDEVAQKVSSTVQGYKDAGIISVIKHFPRHANNSSDPHNNISEVNIKEHEWNSYIQPFVKVLQQQKVDAMMVGHIKFGNIDKFPASISSEIITNRLQNNLNYQGIIISDDMHMKALDGFGDAREIAKQALIAGEDILIYTRYQPDENSLQKEIYTYILQQVRNGTLDIDEKVLKILKKKIEYRIIDVQNYEGSNFLN